MTPGLPVSALSEKQPYPGLRPFGDGDREFFFGRESQTKALREKLKTNRLVAVVGRSGCGKSSLVRAGLLPLLQDEKVWHIATFRPQGRPIAELANELLRLSKEHSIPVARPDANSAPTALVVSAEDRETILHGQIDATLRRGSRGLVEAVDELDLPASHQVLIVIDQFEEIFRYEGASGGDADEAIAFVRLLTEAIRSEHTLTEEIQSERTSTEAIQSERTPIHIMLTMRLDFLGDCARFPKLPEAISDGQFLVPNLSRAERRAAIEEPAKKCGRTVKPAVTQRLLNEIGEDPDQLPVLQHVLMRMWLDSASAPEIELTHYKNTGGVKDAISNHATQAYDSLPSPQHRVAAERLFKAISEIDRRGRAIRRTPAMQFFDLINVVGLPEAVTTDVINAFRAPDRCFLMPPAEELLLPDTRIDIAHESLLRGWSKMSGEAGWIAEESQAGNNYRFLLAARKGNLELTDDFLREQERRWQTIQPNEAWAARYDNEFQAVKEFLENNSKRLAIKARREFLQRAAVLGSIALAVLGVLGGWLAWSISLQRENVLIERQARDLEEKARSAQQSAETRERLEAQLQAQIKEFELLRSEATKKIEEVQRSLPAQASPQVRQDLKEALQSTTARLDSVEQRVAVNPTQLTSKRENTDPQSIVGRNGYMWLGSLQKSNLRTSDGAAVLPNAVQRNKEYLVTTGIYLRSGLPDRTTYTQQPISGGMNEGSRIEILKLELPYPRPTGDQYWAQVKVISVALPTVYFQFAGGSREQAQELSKALQAKGYKIPGEERTGAAAGQRVVRYFDEEDKRAADKLAQDTDQALRDLGYRQGRLLTANMIQPTKSNPDGILELWMEIPPK